MLRALPFCFLSVPAFAQGDLAGQMAGQYGTVNDPAYSCTENPVDLHFTDKPPHAVFTWAKSRQMFDDKMSNEAVYDFRGEVPLGLLLRLEGETRLTAAGDPVLWILRPDADLQGFCWGRPDWPVVQCVNPFRRCDTAPVS